MTQERECQFVETFESIKSDMLRPVKKEMRYSSPQYSSAQDNNSVTDLLERLEKEFWRSYNLQP